jgi:hypothetical protein
MSNDLTGIGSRSYPYRQKGVPRHDRKGWPLKRAQTNLQFYPRLTLDFHTNKKICDEVAVIPSKRLRNKIAGFTTHLMRR